ncbi:YhcG family protein [Candidatus Margulisiibacteriota bacterium]
MKRAHTASMKTNKSKIAEKEYSNLLKNIKTKIKEAQIKTSYTVNRELINLYWNIGKLIVERQKKYGWGKSIVEKLSKDLTKQKHGKGFSTANVWFMRQLYLEYNKKPNLLQLVRDLPWGHNIVIMTKVKNIQEKEYYLKATIEMRWSRNVLLNQIKAKTYERHKVIKKQHNFKKALPKHLAEQADQAMKDVYVLDFLGIKQPMLEREMENRIIEKIKNLILELGYGFCFIGNQYRITLHNKEYFIDLLFYHRKLKCLVALEIKTGKFIPEYAGKMNFYLNLLDATVKESNENPSIGIILCADRNRIEVEYALRGIIKPIGVAEYTFTKKLPKKFINKLPSTKYLKKRILKEFNKNN